MSCSYRIAPLWKAHTKYWVNWPLNTTVDLNWLIWKLISSFVNYLVSQPWLDARFCHDEIPRCVLSTSRIRRWCWSFCGRSWRSGKRGADAEPCHLSKWRAWSRPRVTCARADEEVKASPARLTVPSSRSGRKTIAVSPEGGGGGGGGLGRPGREPMREHAQNRPLTRRN